jgi:hypothetical protein
LNGIIGQGEFRESIEKINRTNFASGAATATTFGFLAIIFVSIILIIFGGINSVDSRSYGFPPLIAAGMGVMFVGMFIFLIAIVVIKLRQAARLRQVVAEESMKYSARSPTPCSWRLETTPYYGANGNDRVGYHVSIC